MSSLRQVSVKKKLANLYRLCERDPSEVWHLPTSEVAPRIDMYLYVKNAKPGALGRTGRRCQDPMIKILQRRYLLWQDLCVLDMNACSVIRAGDLYGTICHHCGSHPLDSHNDTRSSDYAIQASAARNSKTEQSFWTLKIVLMSWFALIDFLQQLWNTLTWIQKVLRHIRSLIPMSDLRWIFQVSRSMCSGCNYRLYIAGRPVRQEADMPVCLLGMKDSDILSCLLSYWLSFLTGLCVCVFECVRPFWVVAKANIVFIWSSFLETNDRVSHCIRGTTGIEPMRIVLICAHVFICETAFRCF